MPPRELGMPTSSCRKTILAMSLGASLLVPWTAMAGSRLQREPRAAHAAAPASPGLLGRFWEGLVSFWEANGCSLDPNGVRCAAVLASGGSGLQPGCATGLKVTAVTPAGNP